MGFLPQPYLLVKKQSSQAMRIQPARILFLAIIDCTQVSHTAKEITLSFGYFQPEIAFVDVKI